VVLTIFLNADGSRSVGVQAIRGCVVSPDEMQTRSESRRKRDPGERVM
jgi:hypothetical protein